MNKLLIGRLILAALAVAAPCVQAHCEIPCGIYDDKARIQAILEDATTVEKSMRKINELGAADQPNWNQLVRWVDNKETHASKIQHVVTQYFMTQRVKVPADGGKKARAAYTQKLSLLHGILVGAMKMKQTTDEAHVTRVRQLVDEFSAAYFSREDLEHLRSHR